MPSTPNDPTEVDVGYGKPIELSSMWGNAENTRQLLPVGHSWSPDHSFHTEFQERPFVIVDLLSSRRIVRLRLFNRESYADRAIPLTISTSHDKEIWSEIARINHSFGGRKSGEPLDLKFHKILSARYFKFQVETSTFFHLDYIEILAPLPDMLLGRLQKLDAKGPSIRAEYYHHNSYGLTWTFTSTLAEISACLALGTVISRVDYSYCLIPFKDRPETDLYPILFAAQPIPDEQHDLSPLSFRHHGVYVHFDLAMLNKYAERYFSPSCNVAAFRDKLVQQYAIQPDNAMALVFRGTDKSSEVLPTPIERYIEFALVALRIRPDLQIVIQTDQRQALETVLNAIPQAIWFQEMPVTSGNTVMHHLPLEAEFSIRKSDFAVRMVAVVNLLSSFKYVVTHTGNMGFWLACYRGRPEGFYQFDAEAKLRGPLGDVIENLEYTAIF